MSADAGDAGDAADATEEGIAATTTPDNWNCSASPHATLHASSAIFVAAMFGACILRRRRHLAALAFLAPSLAHAQDAIVEQDPPTRHFAVYVNPLSLVVDRYGGSIEVLLASHHAIEAGAYYVYSATNSDTNNVFSGVGGELGYRFYLGKNGFRGFYAGPSFLIAALEATPQTGASVSFVNLGGALDIGWEALVVDRVLVGLGVGAQYTAATKSFPAQQIPASVYANDGIRPRVSVAIGVAF